MRFEDCEVLMVAKTDPHGGLVVPQDTSTLSESTRQWLDSLPLRNTPAQVLARFAAVGDTPEEREDARVRSEKLTAKREAREDAQTVMMLRGEEPPSLSDRFAEWSAMEELAAINAKRTREAEAKARVEQQEQRIRELEAELARERQAHSRTSGLYHEAVTNWGRARRRAAERETPEQYARNYGSSVRFRSGGGIIGGPY